MGPPGQPLHRRVSRYFWGFPPFLALVETIALAVHFQDMDMVGEAVQQSPGQAFRAEYLRPLIERQVGGHQDRAPLVALAEDFEQQLGAGLRERHEAEFVDDQKVILWGLTSMSAERPLAMADGGWLTTLVNICGHWGKHGK